MSNTLIDERFELNRSRADAISYRTALVIIILVTFLTLPRVGSEILLRILLTTIMLSFSLAVNLKSYLLYRFDMEE